MMEKDAKYWLKKGTKLEKQGKHEEALKCFDKAIEINPEYAEAWNNKGNALYELKKYDEAIRCYDKAIEINPEYAEAWNNKGIALYELKKYDEAIRCYDKAIEINPGDAGAWNNKGIALYELKKYDEAIRCYDKAIEINPELAEAWYNKGELLYGLRDYSSSEEVTEKSLEISPSFDAYFLMGKIYVMKGKFKEATEYFENAKKLKSSDIYSVIWRIYAKYMDISYPPESFKNIKEKEREETVEYQKGISLQILEVEELIKTLEERGKSEESKAIPILYYWLAIFYAKVGGYLSSVENFDKSISSLKKLIKNLKKNVESDGIESLEETEKKAKHLLRYVWNSKINSTFWNWWLFSPKNLFKKIKLTIFIIFDTILSFLLVCPWVNLIMPNLRVPTISWNYWLVSIVSIFFILLSPLLTKIGVKDIDMEISSPSELMASPVSFMPIMKETMGRELL